MIRITQLKMEIHNENFKKKIASILKVMPDQIGEYRIRKRSIDARKKPELYFVYTVDVQVYANPAVQQIANPTAQQKVEKANKFERSLVEKLHNPDVTIAEPVVYQFPYRATESFYKSQDSTLKKRPIVVGSGPAGLFCAYFLAQNGFCPIVIERGEPVEDRQKSVDRFWETGVLNKESNVQFGEGGAGTFSDGKLNTLVKDKDGRNTKVMELFIQYGADPQILYDYKAHLGTDMLVTIISNMRKDMIRMGAEFKFNTCMKRLLIQEEKDSGRVTGTGTGEGGTGTESKRIIGIETTDGRIFSSDQVILAIGHSARDTFETLYSQNIPMESKDFAVGFRVMHPQKLINHSQYGMDEVELLGAAPYKLAGAELAGRNAYSFCMCPGGFVVNASSEEGRLAVNGMSYRKRDSENANSAIIMTVRKEDFATSDSPLAGIAFQRELEEKAYQAGQGKIPVESLGDFRRGVIQEKPEMLKTQADQLQNSRSEFDSYFEDFAPCIKGNYTQGAVHSILPEELNETFLHAMQFYDRKIHGFNHDRTMIAGIESRTSSPIRILRDDSLQSSIRGLYPCGEGAGYAGGITSAAMDGIRVAEQVAAALLE